jgi:hypothetical protein
MTYSNELVEEIKELSQIPEYTPGEIAKIVGISVEELMSVPGLREAYDYGQLKLRGDFGKKVVQLSNNGSGPAQTLLKKMIQEQETRTMREYYG